jgi:hypothetical protein
MPACLSVMPACLSVIPACLSVMPACLSVMPACLSVMPALEAGIHANTGQVAFAWMAGSSPAMTEGAVPVKVAGP